MPATITMGKGSNSSSSSSINSTNRTARSSAAQPTSFSRSKKDHATDLRLTLGFPTAHRLEQWQQSDWVQSDHSSSEMMSNYDMEVDESDNTTFYVKVYMEGIPIGRKLDLLAHGGYFALIAALNYMFGTTILWSEEDGTQAEGCHVLTYEDGEGDWLMVGDVPWEMFLSSVKRLKVMRIGGATGETWWHKIARSEKASRFYR